MVKTYSLLFFLSCLLVIALGSQSLAQGRKPGDPSGPKPGQNNPSSTEQDDADAAAGATGCAGCGACGVFGVVVMVVVPIVTALVTLILNIVLMIWVNKDAKARGMENGVIWMCLIFFTGPIGWIMAIIYIFSRTPGQLIACSHCTNSRLQVSKTCPHCGND